jgi:hypothetical protein
MDELFYTPQQASEWVSAQTQQAITPQQLLQYAERGLLPICFRYRGNLGVFENPSGITDGAIGAHDLFPVEQRHVYFDGYLRSLSPCQLQVRFRKILPKPAEWTEDILKPRAVECAGAPVHCHPPLPDLPAGCFIGRARDDGRLETGNVPPAEWLYSASDLAGLIARLMPAAPEPPLLRGGDRLRDAIVNTIADFRLQHGRLPRATEVFDIFARDERNSEIGGYVDADGNIRWEDFDGSKRTLSKEKFLERVRRALRGL